MDTRRDGRTDRQANSSIALKTFVLREYENHNSDNITFGANTVIELLLLKRHLYKHREKTLIPPKRHFCENVTFTFDLDLHTSKCVSIRCTFIPNKSLVI